LFSKPFEKSIGETDFLQALIALNSFANCVEDSKNEVVQVLTKNGERAHSPEPEKRGNV